MKTHSILFLIFSHALLCQTHAADNDLYARIALFVAEGDDVPEHYQERLSELATRTENFFVDGMAEWDIAVARKEFFSRDNEGKIEVSLVRGTLTKTGRDALPELQGKTINATSRQRKINPRKPTTWWIFYQADGVNGFQGRGGPESGLAVNAYPAGISEIEANDDLAGKKFDGISLKGAVHEFGHALGLPHIGPNPAEKRGNSLMGPINKVYWRTENSTDPKVYLNQASAAVLKNHPIFQLEKKPADMPEKIEVNDLKVTEKDATVVITGKLNADLHAHTAVLLDSARSKFGDYWARSYVGSIEENGNFRITVTEPFKKGSIFLSFCFDNGVTTADGKKLFIHGSAIEVPYTTNDGKRSFNIP